MMTYRPFVSGTFGMVSASDWLAAAGGMAMLERGGNAFDAAVAAGFILQVAEPHMSGPGGELAALFWSASEGRVRVLCGQGPAPANAKPDLFAGYGLDAVPSSGLLAAPVPGAFDAWLLMLRDYGSMTLRDVLDPAIGYAEHGVPVLPTVTAHLARSQKTFRQWWPTSAAVYLRTGARPQAFALHRNRTLAGTYQRIMAESEVASGDRQEQIEVARKLWRCGFVAEEVDKFASTAWPDLTGASRPGVLTADDMGRYRATYDDPVSWKWGEWTVCKPGAWTQGPVLLQQLALLAGYLDGGASKQLTSPEDIHMFVESAKLAFADRDAYYGDVPDVPLDVLLSPGYTDERRTKITAEVSRRLRPGRAGDQEPRLPRRYDEYLDTAGDAKPGIAGTRDVPDAMRMSALSRDTCHIDAIDRFGNLVAVTSSGGFFMTSPIIPSLGFPLSCRLEMTWLEAGLPNTLRPGRRPRTTLSPTLALRNGEPALALGSPGADLQEQWALAYLIRVKQGVPPQQAVELPTFCSEHVIGSPYPHDFHPGRLKTERPVGEQTIEELIKQGHDVVVTRPLISGRLSAAGRDPGSGLLFAVADPRYAQVYACGR